MKKRLQPALLAASVMLVGCLDTGSDASYNDDENHDDQKTSLVSVAFDPENEVLPFPNNLLFRADQDGALDGTLNAPIDDPDDDSAAVVKALNQLDGFSTIAPWRVEFTGSVEETTITAGETIRVFKMSSEHDSYPERTEPTGVERELKAGKEFTLRYKAAQDELLIIPTEPLDTGTTYTAVITKGIQDTEGLPLSSPLQWSIARGTTELDQCDERPLSNTALLQCTTNPAIAPVVDDSRFDLSRDDMLLAWGATTQREDSTFEAVFDHIQEGGWDNARYENTECSQPLCFLDAKASYNRFDINPENLWAPESEEPEEDRSEDKARIWLGTVQTVSMLEAPEDANPDGHPATDDRVLSTHWECDDGSCNRDAARGLTSGGDPERPEERGRRTSPILMAIPDAQGDGWREDPEVEAPERPPQGYPLVIFQHAIQQDRTNALAMANTLAEHGFAVIAMDMPLHGLVENQLGGEDRGVFHANNINDYVKRSTAATRTLPLMSERTHYLALGDNPYKIDPSGEHFLNPAEPLNQRDLLRQGAADLAALTHFLANDLYEQCKQRETYEKPQCDAPGSLEDLIDTSELHFVGHSLGNLVAAPFLAHDNHMQSVSMLAPMGSVTETLRHSETIGPQLDEGLAENEVMPGTEDYYRFFAVVQAAVDSVDTINHTDAIPWIETEEGNREQRPVYLSQMVGNDDTAEATPADLVIPPKAGDSAPLAGSEPLARRLGLRFEPVDGQTPIKRHDGTSDGLQVAISFTHGGHATPLLPDDETDDPRQEDDDATVELPNASAAHKEMQRQVGDFLADPSQLDVDTELVEIQTYESD